MEKHRPKNQILAQWLKKIESKIGFSHKRFCVLTPNELLIYKKEYHELDHHILIKPELKTEIIKHNDSLQLLFTPPNESSICLSADEKEPILNWAQQIRNLLLITKYVN